MRPRISQGFYKSVAKLLASIDRYLRRCAETRMTPTLVAVADGNGNDDGTGGVSGATITVDAATVEVVVAVATAAAAVVAAAAGVVAVVAIYCAGCNDAGAVDSGTVAGDEDANDDGVWWCENNGDGREPRSLIQALPRRYLLVLLLLPKQVRGPVREVEESEYDWEEDPRDDVDALGPRRELGQPRPAAVFFSWLHM